MIVHKKSKRVICINFINGKCPNFNLFKTSGVRIHQDIKTITDSGYEGIQKIHLNAELPQKKTKQSPLTKEDKQQNRAIASERIINEQVIGQLKRFKIIADCYRNRRKRFGLRFNLIAGIYNFELN